MKVVVCLYDLLMLLAAASIANPLPLRIQVLISCEYYLPILFIVLTPSGLLFQCSRQVWSLTTLAWESLRLGLGKDMVPSFISRTLSPICILIRSRILFRFRCYLDLYIVSLYSWLGESLLYICSFVGSIMNYCNDHHNSTRITCVLRHACYAWWAS